MGLKSSEEAEAFFEEIKEKGLKPDVVTYNSLIDVYCKDRAIEKAYKLIDKMREEDETPDVITYTTIIGGLGLISQPSKAREVFKEMKEYGCYPDVAAYNAAIRNYCIARRLEDADMLLDEMVRKGLIKMFKRHQKVDMAMRLWEDMVVKGFGSYSLVSVVFLDLLCDLAKVEKCLLEMVEKGHRPSNVSFKRIKLLMELANKHAEVNNLIQKMAIFGT